MTCQFVEFPCTVSVGFTNQQNDYYGLWFILAGTVTESYVRTPENAPDAM